LKRNVSGIWYELRKKPQGKQYDASFAKHLSYVRMRKQRTVGKKIALDPQLRKFVEDGLLDDQSPDAISGRLRRVEKTVPYFSPAAIKRYIKSVYGRKIESHRAKIFKRPRRGGRKKSVLDGRRLISKRPNRINERKGIGHMEGDFIVSGKSGKGLGLVLIDRNLRKVVLERILPVSVRNVERALVRMKKRFPEITTITFDNDILFLEHKRLERILKIKIYFCHPRSPWEKPSVENFNRWLRRYVPKASDISRFTRYFFSQLEAKANRRFMDVLKFHTPDEMYARALKRKKRPKARSKEKK
jgi:IS30 family transposase